MRTWLLFLALLSAGVSSVAQESASVFNFLKLPVSAHAAALGGNNVSALDDDASLIFQNPALLANVSDRSLNLNFATYLQGMKAGGAAFAKAIGSRGTWGATAQFVHYGSMKQTTAADVQVGDFSALDMALSGLFCYNLTDRWAGGVTAKFIYSGYGDFTSMALAADLGLNYYDEDQDLSISLVAANLGSQVKAFGDDYEKLPADLRAGFTKGMFHAPLTFSVTMTDLTRWSADDFYNPEKEEESFGRILMNHVTVGVDYTPTNYLYLSAGYNFRRAHELKAAGSAHGAGLSFGAGLSLRRFKLNMAYAKYHVSTPSLVFSTSYIF